MDQKSKDAGIALGILWASRTITMAFRKSCKSMFVSVVVSTEDGYASLRMCLCLHASYREFNRGNGDSGWGFDHGIA